MYFSKEVKATLDKVKEVREGYIGYDERLAALVPLVYSMTKTLSRKNIKELYGDFLFLYDSLQQAEVIDNHNIEEYSDYGSRYPERFKAIKSAIKRGKAVLNQYYCLDNQLHDNYIIFDYNYKY